MKALLLTPEDTVATVLQATAAGDELDVLMDGAVCGSIRAIEEIPYGFKICVKPMAKGAPVIKYAHTIGRATSDIAPGALVHVNNVEGGRGRGDLGDEDKGDNQ